MATAAILTAAGSGVRLGREQPKALVEIAGAPVFIHAARNLAASGAVDQLVVTAPRPRVQQYTEMLAADPYVTVPVTVIAGGGTRQESVARALDQLPKGFDVVLVHDAARPFAPPGLTKRVVDAVHAGNLAVIPALPVSDTIKQVTPTNFAIGEPYRRAVVPRKPRDPDVIPVAFTPPREHLRVIQTPQGFDRRTLERAFAAGAARGAVVTDDAALVEGLGVEVVTIPGDEAAAKITTERDLRIAEFLHGGPPELAAAPAVAELVDPSDDEPAAA